MAGNVQEDDQAGVVHANGPHQCSFFKRTGTFPRCNGCSMVHYCSEKHQKDDWKAHRSFCKPIIDARKARQGAQPECAASTSAQVTAAARDDDERGAGVYVVLNGEGYRFQERSSQRSQMLRRLHEFPIDRPQASLDLPRAAIKAWEAGDCSEDMSDEDSVEVSKVRTP
jgi:MYND finger